MKEERPSPKGSVYIVPDRNDFDIARDYYLNNDIISWYDRMKQGARKLHGRNYYQVFSMNIGTIPATSVVIYAAKEDNKGVVKGGTRSAVMIARNEKIPTFNLEIKEQKEKILKVLDKKENISEIRL